jgi:23S rRNA pseudouridine1911/1915/1917 synthase
MGVPGGGNSPRRLHPASRQAINSFTVTSAGPLLAALLARWPDAKRKQVLTWLKHGTVHVNGRAVTQFDHSLVVGDVVHRSARGHAPAGTHVGSHIKVRHEDDAVIVIEKPSGLLSIASEGERERSAYFQLTEHVRGADPRSRGRIWIVHRLDRDTSGLMVFAKTVDAKRVLQTGWEAVEKKYYAVVEGRPPEPRGTWVSHLDERDPLRVRSAPPGPHTREATTHYRVVKTSGARSVLELTLVTGRRHQIRVHLGDAGCPVVGDKRYGATSDPVRRVGLHAWRLRFRHPVTDAMLSFECPLPGELGKLVARPGPPAPGPPGRGRTVADRPGGLGRRR